MSGGSPPASGGAAFRGRLAKEEHEAASLASAALASRLSRGRAHPEPEDELRTCYERDRDRIVHCTGFRRLMVKTQVFVSSRGDHNRTRLSHTLEVAQVARSVGSALALNEPFCEALALAHDIGHPPFGHSGEKVLDRLMRDRGGFRHNAQVLRVVDLLERRSPDYAGLNLTRELRASVLKHEARADWPDDLGPPPRTPYLEAQVVDLADSTAYDVHDLEDGLREGIFTERELHADVALWREAVAAVEARHPGFLEHSGDTNLRDKRVTNELLKLCINDLIANSADRIRDAAPGDAEEVRRLPTRLVAHGSALRPRVAELQAFLFERFYRHPQLMELAQRAADVIEGLFGALLERPDEMPPWYRSWVDAVGPHRAVCDYVAGMTDRFAEREHHRLAGGTRRGPTARRA